MSINNQNRVIFRFDSIEERKKNAKVSNSDQGSLGSSKRFGKSSVIQVGFRASDFQTRKQTLQNIRIPESNSRVHIIRSIIDGWGYQVATYDPIFCLNIPEDRFKETIRKCNRLLGRSYSEKKNDMKTPKNSLLNFLVVIGISISLTAFGLLEFIIFEKIDSVGMLSIPILLFLLTMILGIAIFVLSFFLKPKKRIKNEDIYENLKSLLSRDNKNFYENLGYQWVVPKKFLWLELHKISQPIV